MKKIITILMAMVLFIVPLVSAGYSTTYNPFTSRLDYVRDGNWSDYNGTMEFPAIDVAGGYSGGGVSIYDNGDFWTKGDLYLDNGTVFLITNPVINGTFTPAIDDTFDFGSQALRWKDAYLMRALTSNGSAASPSISFINDQNTGFYNTPNNLWVSIDGAVKYYFGGSFMGSSTSAGAGLKTASPTSTNPGIVPVQSDPDTGIGRQGADNLSLIAGGVESLRLLSDFVYSKLPFRLEKDTWLQSWNNASDSAVNMFKVNEDDEILVGSTLVTGNTEIAEDSGVVTLVDMPVSSSVSSGDEMSYAFRMDGETIFKVFAQADGVGGIVNQSIVLTNGAKIYDNSTCLILASPDGSNTYNLCNT